jgi:hypothetical protein
MRGGAFFCLILKSGRCFAYIAPFKPITHLKLKAMKKAFILVTLLFLGMVSTQAQTDEQLREEIRKEVKEELRRETIRQEEMERERLRLEQEKQAEIDRLMAERIELRKKEDAARVPEVNERAEANKKRRKYGWSISAQVGPNFPLGKLANTKRGTGHFGKTGVAFTLNNTIMFGNVMGVQVGFGYDSSPFDDYALSQEMRYAYGNPPGFSFTVRGVPFENYSVRGGPVIRALGGGVAFHFRPYIGLNIMTGGSATLTVSNGSEQMKQSLVRKQESSFLAGVAWDLSFHVAKHSDLVLGLDLMMSWFSNFVEERVTGEDTRFGQENMELLRLAPTLGYRFHL